MTVLNLWLHSDNSTIGSSRLMERFHPCRAASPIVAAKCSDINPPIVGTRKERSTVFNQTSFRRGKSHNRIYPCILTLIPGIRVRYNLAISVGQDKYILSSFSHKAF